MTQSIPFLGVTLAIALMVLNINVAIVKVAADRSSQPNFICFLSPDPGPCEALTARWFFNTTSGKCEQFRYGGCLGNENNFVTRRECQETCRYDCVFVDCFADPCDVKDCPAFPDANCVQNFCTDCEADFTDELGFLVDCQEDS